MISNKDEAYVWIWLPKQTSPVVAGKLTRQGEQYVFNYGKSYLKREDAMSLFDGELPLLPGFLPLTNGLNMPGVIRDGSPDAWGRRVILHRKMGEKVFDPNVTELDELTYLLESGSDRIGALDFQKSPTVYEPRFTGQATLEELLESADRVEKGLPVSKELDQALQLGTALGGARPKAMIDGRGKKMIAKFSVSTDLYNVVKAEFVAMRLAEKIGLNVAKVSLAKALKRDVLLIERFDRVFVKGVWQRRHMLSALTLLKLDTMWARYASYEDFAEIIRHKFSHPRKALKELFGRMVFNILCGNTDDHAKNHAAFYDGKTWSLTPAFDICPQARTGFEASQGMLIHAQDRLSKVSSCFKAAPKFLLTEKEAKTIVKHQVKTIKKYWDDVCDEAKVSKVDRQFFWGRQFLNPYAFDDLGEPFNNLPGL